MHPTTSQETREPDHRKDATYVDRSLQLYAQWLRDKKRVILVAITERGITNFEEYLIARLPDLENVNRANLFSVFEYIDARLRCEEFMFCEPF